MVEINDTIKKIAKLRDERGWTNHRMAIEAGIGSATVQNWYTHNAIPKQDALTALCEAFGITLSEFYNEESEPVSLSKVQKEFLAEFDCLGSEEKQGLLSLLKAMNATRKRFN